MKKGGDAGDSTSSASLIYLISFESKRYGISEIEK